MSNNEYEHQRFWKLTIPEMYTKFKVGLTKAEEVPINKLGFPKNITDELINRIYADKIKKF